MKSTKFLTVFVVLAGLILSSCSGLGSAVSAVTSAGTSALSLPAAASQSSAPEAASAAAAPDVIGLQNAYQAIYENVNPSVVTIQVSSRITNTSGFGSSGDQGPVVPSGEGSGFVWDTSGHIVTNNHVVEGADKISVTFSDGSTYEAKLVGADPNSDLAVVQVSGAPASLLKPVTVADSTQVKVGQLVVAIGNPYGQSNTMTTGIVSAISRSISARASNSLDGSAAPSFSIPDVIQTDAAINPGNSGGVLLDINGALIGVPSQIESGSGTNSGVGFAIPSSIVSKVVPQLISNGKAERSYLGISGGTLTADAVSALELKTGQQGVLIASVAEGGPAEKAGLKATTFGADGSLTAAGDIITGIDGKTVNRFEDLISYLYNNTQPGQVVTLTVLREGKEIQVKVTLGTQPTT